MSSSLAAAKAAVISLSLILPSGTDKSVLKFPATSSVAPRGSWLMAAMTSSIVKAYSGAKYHPTMYHLWPPDAS